MSSIAVQEYYYISKSSDGNMLQMIVRVNQNLGITFRRLINMVCSAPHAPACADTQSILLYLMSAF